MDMGQGELIYIKHASSYVKLELGNTRSSINTHGLLNTAQCMKTINGIYNNQNIYEPMQTGCVGKYNVFDIKGCHTVMSNDD